MIMQRVRPLIALILIILGLTVAEFAAMGLSSCDGSRQKGGAANSDQTQQSLRLEIPNADWEPKFDEALSERRRLINLPDLRRLLPDDDIEIRFWYDARPDTINGFAIRRSNNNWQAVGIRQKNQRWPSDMEQNDLGVPKSGWDALWKKLLDSDILVLRDEAEGNCRYLTLDGAADVIETNVSRTYRTYRWSNPTISNCAGAKRVAAIEQIIGEEFKIEVPEKE
jgi:hypothetical protein